jgi:AmiR/NasT family two-component response regulator
MGYLVKPFQKSDVVPAIELAVARHQELATLEGEVRNLADRLETRTLVDRAKGMLMDRYGMKEADAFRFLQKTAMDRRLRLAEVAGRVIDGELKA